MLNAVVISGANGSGKTSLTRLLIGALREAEIEADVILETTHAGTEVMQIDILDPGALAKAVADQPVGGTVRVQHMRGARIGG